MKTAAAQSAPELIWDDGIGFLDPGPNPERIYDLAYFNKYVGYAETELGEALTAARLELVERFCADDLLCDVGIGCGQFIEARRGETRGYDVNPLAIEWLHQRELWLDPREATIPALTFWDSLEHLVEPGPFLGNVTGYVFVSAPIYRDMEHCLSSKHFRPVEHVWYWTHEGLIRFMEHYGFQLVEHNTMETDLGRESIGTYVFRRQRRPYLTNRCHGRTIYLCPWCPFDSRESGRMLTHLRGGHINRKIRLIEGGS